MPDVIVSRLLRLPGYGVYACEADETAGTLTLWVRQTVAEPYYVCGGCGISVRDVHNRTERRLRDLPWGEWQVWLAVEVHRVRCRRCGVRTERLPFVTGKAHYNNAQLNHSWAKVFSPITGIAGIKNANLADLISTNTVLMRRCAPSST